MNFENFKWSKNEDELIPINEIRHAINFFSFSIDRYEELKKNKKISEKNKKTIENIINLINYNLAILNAVERVSARENAYLIPELEEIRIAESVISYIYKVNREASKLKKEIA